MTGASLEGEVRAATEATTTLPMIVGSSHAGAGLGEAAGVSSWVGGAGSFPFAPSADRCLGERPGTPANDASATMTSAPANSSIAFRPDLRSSVIQQRRAAMRQALRD